MSWNTRKFAELIKTYLTEPPFAKEVINPRDRISKTARNEWSAIDEIMMDKPNTTQWMFVTLDEGETFLVKIVEIKTKSDANIKEVTAS